MNILSSRGFSLIELLLVLGVIALLLVGAFVVYPQVRDRNLANQSVATVMAAKANIANLYGSKRYIGLNNQVARDARIFPPAMYSDNSAGTATAAWGRITVVGLSPDFGDYRMAISLASPAVCLGLISGVHEHFHTVVAAGISIKDESARIAYNPSVAAFACSNLTGAILLTSK